MRFIATVFSLALITAWAMPAAAAPMPGGSFTPNLHLQFGGPPGTIFLTQDTEPEIRVDSDGHIFVAAIHGVPGGTDLFLVAPNGLSYMYKGEPDGLPVLSGPTQLAPGGGDADLAIGSFKGATSTTQSVCSFTTTGRCQPGPLTITSLNLATVYASQTSNQGNSYTPSPNANGVIAGDDRQWNNAFGGLERYDVVHDLYTDSIDFAKSMDGGLTWLNGVPANSDILPITVQNTDIGPIVVDQNETRQKGPILYSVFLSTATAAENVAGAPQHTVWVSHSTDDGASWHSVIAYNGPITIPGGYRHIFPSIAVDARGNLFAVFSDDKDVFMVYSTNGGVTWKGAGDKVVGPVPAAGATPIKVTDSTRDGGFHTHIFPWIAAGTNGGVDVVYYETTGATPDLATNNWYVGMAQNLNVPGINGLSRTFTYFTPSDHIIHKGQVCEGGTGCTGGRQLADDFQIALDRHGLANIAYANDADPKTGATQRTTQTYFTKQVLGVNLGTPNGDGPNQGCTLAGRTIATNVQPAGVPSHATVKAPQGASRGWLTVLENRSVPVAGYINQYHSVSSTSAQFAGISTRGVPFTGSVQNGKLTVNLGASQIAVAATSGTYAL